MQRRRFTLLGFLAPLIALLPRSVAAAPAITDYFQTAPSSFVPIVKDSLGNNVLIALEGNYDSSKGRGQIQLIYDAGVQFGIDEDGKSVNIYAENGIRNSHGYYIQDQLVCGPRGDAIANADGSLADATRAINAILAQMRADGKIAT